MYAIETWCRHTILCAVSFDDVEVTWRVPKFLHILLAPAKYLYFIWQTNDSSIKNNWGFAHVCGLCRLVALWSSFNWVLQFWSKNWSQQEIFFWSQLIFSLGINSVKRLTSFDGRAPAIATNPAGEKAIKQRMMKESVNKSRCQGSVKHFRVL